MRGLFVFILSLLLIKANAQGINFQGVARSANGTILSSQKISLKLSIINGSSTGTAEYVETRTVSTNAQGIFSVVIGDTGTTTNIGSYANVNWKLSSKFLKVEMDPTGGSNFISMGTTTLQYVPYSYYSNGVDAANVSGILPVKSGGTGVASVSEMKVALTLDKVNNTADLDKPISKIMQTALDVKLNNADTASLSNRINNKFSKTDILSVENGGTGVNDLSKLKAALKLDTSSLSLPTVTSTNASSITAGGATILGNITNDGGSTILRQGICFDTIPIPNTSVSQVMFIDPSNSGTNLLTGVFDASITSYCNPSTKYYYRTFAVNKNGTAYSDVRTFTTLSAITFSTNPTVTVDRNALSFNISVKANGDTLKSFSLHFKENGLSLPGDILDKVITITNTVNDTLINYNYPKYLNANKNYTCEISITSIRVSVKKEITISTNNVTLPSVQSLSVGLVYLPQFSGNSYGYSYNILSKGGGDIINSGVIWTTSLSITPNISLTTKTVNTTNPSSPEIILTTNLIGLSPGVLYYLTPYVTNSVGTSYGNPISFTTQALIPSLGTLNATSISNNSAILGGQITNDGGSSITASGVVWTTTSQTPTVSLTTKTTLNIGSGIFTSTITGLSPATTYYVRAYATNSLGTAYGPVTSFTSVANVPILSGTITPTFNGAIALSGGTISSANGSNIIERGIIYDQNSNPNYSNGIHITSNLDNNLTFQCLTQFLNTGTTYYFKSYAINADGIGYGPTAQLVIPPALPLSPTLNYANLLSTSVLVSVSSYSPDGAPFIDKGFIWSTSSSNISLSLTTKQSLGSVTGSSSGTISNLTPNTTYYIKGYATNASGTSYSGIVQITTPN